MLNVKLSKVRKVSRDQHQRCLAQRSLVIGKLLRKDVDVGKVCSNSFGNGYFGVSVPPCGRRCRDKSGTRARGCGKCSKSALSWPCPVRVYRRDTTSTTNVVASRMNSTLLRGCLNLASCAPTFASPLRPRPIGSLRLLHHFILFLAIYLFSFRFSFHSFSLLPAISRLFPRVRACSRLFQQLTGTNLAIVPE